MTDVGVETFSLTLKSKLRIEKEQMSTPLPVIAENIPPRKPVAIKTTACQTPNMGMESNVNLLCCLEKKYLNKFFNSTSVGSTICLFISLFVRVSKN